MRIKSFTDGGLKELIARISGIEKTTEDNTSSLVGLGNDLGALAENTTAALRELDDRKVDKSDIDTIVHSLHAAIFSGEVPAALYSASGQAVATDGGMEIYAIKKFSVEGGG